MYLSIYLPTYLSIYLFVCLLSVCLSVYLQAWKRSYSARLPQFLNLAASKMEQFCETSSIFELDNVKNEAILREFLNFWTWQHQKRNHSARLPQFSKLTTSKSAAPVTQNHLPKTEDAAKCNLCPDLLTALMKHVSCTAPATENASLHILFKCPTPAVVFGNATKPARFAHFWQGAQSLAPATRNDIWTSKSGPNPQFFCTFDFEMCFAPQRCALFRHLNFQKWSKHEVFCTFWLRHVLRATTVCTFSTSQLLKVLRSWCVLCILTSKCASRHNGVHSLCSDAKVLCTFWLGNVLRATTACNFSSLIWPAGSAPAALASLLFDHPEPQIIGKTQCLATFPTFSRTWIFFLLRLSLFWSSFFFSSLLWLFPSLLFICPYCRKFDL